MENKRDKKFMLRMTGEAYDKLRQTAKAYNLKMSDIVRRGLDKMYVESEERNVTA